jgi:hypothetical protein
MSENKLKRRKSTRSCAVKAQPCDKEEAMLKARALQSGVSGAVL